MVFGNWRNGSANKYGSKNKYEQPDPKAAGDTGPATAAPLAIVQRSRIEHFQPRHSAPPAIYTPVLGTRRRDRRRAEQHIGNLRLATEIAEAATTLQGGLTKLEESHQAHEAVEQRRAQIGAKIELENLELGTRVMEEETLFEAAVERRVDERVDRERQRQLDSENYEIAMANKRAERLQAQAREKAAEERLARASEIGRRQADAEVHKASGTAFENEADAEAERRRRDQARQRRAQGPVADTPDMPEPLARHYATERKVQESQRTAQEMAEAIRRQAQAENRDLTDDEAERIDALLSAAAGAENAIRRGDATDFEV